MSVFYLTLYCDARKHTHTHTHQKKKNLLCIVSHRMGDDSYTIKTDILDLGCDNKDEDQVNRLE